MHCSKLVKYLNWQMSDPLKVHVFFTTSALGQSASSCNVIGAACLVGIRQPTFQDCRKVSPTP